MTDSSAACWRRSTPRPSRIPVVLGGCGSGRTTLLHALADRLGRDPVPVHRRRARGEHAGALLPRGGQRLAVPVTAGAGAHEPAVGARRVRSHAAPARPRARRATRRPRSCSTRSSSCARSRASRACATCCARLLHALAESGNRFVLTSRYVARAHRLLRDAGAALRGHPPAGAVAGRGHRDAAADGRHAGRGSRVRWAAPSRRWPTAAPPTCARWARPRPR